MAYRYRWQWLSMGLLTVLVGILAVLQYRWIGQTSEALRSTMRESLRSALANVSRDFNADLRNALRTLSPSAAEVRKFGRAQAYRQRYAAWQSAGGETALFRRAAAAWSEQGEARIAMLPRAGEPERWPDNWSAVRQWVETRGFSLPGQQKRPNFGIDIVDLPRFDEEADQPGEQDWLVLEIDTNYVSGTLLPRLLVRYLGPNFNSQYRYELSTKGDPSEMLFSSDPRSPRIRYAMGMVPLFSMGGPREDDDRSPREHGPPRLRDLGWPARWVLAVELRGGSVDSFVAQTRRRDLAVAGILMVLLLAASATLIKLSHQSQRLASMQIEFVSSVSHELRTPISVIRTAAFNLRGAGPLDTARVARYSQLISAESQRLTEIVEQILQFAGGSRNLARQRIAVSVSELIDGGIETASSLIRHADCQVETAIEPGVPAILGDPLPLRQALANLISNAIKYGLGEQRWIGIFARRTGGESASAVEIQIVDRGPGIPADEQKHIFDAFFRGSRAIAGQIHGTGLGLNLVKRTIEANGGSISLVSNPGAGAAFILTLPAQL